MGGLAREALVRYCEVVAVDFVTARVVVTQKNPICFKPTLIWSLVFIYYEAHTRWGFRGVGLVGVVVDGSGVVVDFPRKSLESGRSLRANCGSTGAGLRALGGNRAVRSYLTPWFSLGGHVGAND